MDTTALTMVSKLVCKQNQILLQKVAEKYKLPEEELKNLYLTPTFHKIILTDNKDGSRTTGH